MPHDDSTVGKSEDLLHGSSDTQRLIKPQPSFQNDKGYALLGSAEAFGRIAIGGRQELLSLHETMTDALLAGKLTEALEASAALYEDHRQFLRNLLGEG